MQSVDGPNVCSKGTSASRSGIDNFPALMQSTTYIPHTHAYACSMTYIMILIGWYMMEGVQLMHGNILGFTTFTVSGAEIQVTKCALISYTYFI